MSKYSKVLNLLIKNATKVNRRNKSLLMRQTRKSKDFDLANSSTNKLAEILYQVKPGQHAIAKSGLAAKKEQEKSHKLSKIHRKSNLIREDTGISPLAVGYPFFEGWLNEWYRGPLILIPVELQLVRKNNQPGKWVFQVNEDEKVGINLALLITLQQELGLEFDPDQVPAWEAKNIKENPDQFWREVEAYFPDELISEWSILTQKLQELPEISTDETPAESEGNRFELKPYGILGHFPQGKNPLVNDLIKLKDYVDEDDLPDLIEHMLGEENGNTIKEVMEEKVENVDEFSEQERLKIMPTDATQEEVLLQAKKTKSLVVQGPPGTGKSQTIVNLIGDSLYNDEQVLVVCEKRVALEVVEEMLNNLGLDFLTVMVGGKAGKKHQARDHVYNTLRQIAQTKKEGTKIRLDRHSRTVDKSIDQLNKLNSALTEPIVEDAPELPVHKLYKELEPVSKKIINQLVSLTEVNQLETLEQRIETVENWLDLRTKLKDDSIWKQRFLGSLAQVQVTEEKLQEIVQAGRDSQVLAPLKKYLTEEKYQQAVELTGTEEYLSQEALQVVNQNQESLFRFISPQWLQARIKLANNQWKIKNQFADLKAQIKELTNWFPRSIFEDQLAALQDGNEIVDFVEQLEADWQCDEHILNRLDKIYQAQTENFRRDLEQLLEISGGEVKKGVNIYERAVKTIWLKQKQAENPELNWFVNNKYQEVREKLAENLTAKREKGAEYLKRKYQQKQKEILTSSQGQKIVKLSRRQRKLPSLRKFLQQHGELVRSILPVWLASPDQVSKLFSFDDQFDHVIFDEASQVSLEDALPSLARAKQVTVVGDKKQMPPNRLFQRTLDSEDSKNLAEDAGTSLLDKADDVWPDKMLKYHYRSKHPELIEFSNQAFYDGQLKIAPEDKVEADNFRALHWHQVDGSWVDQTNPEEAEAVINYLLDQLPEEEQSADKTLWGVVTFNQNQAGKLFDVLQQSLADKRRNNQELTKPEQQIWEWCVGSRLSNPYVWIKNLENVQGDEVKHLIMSVGYAVDPKMGRVPNRFGLLNRAGGEKRLNVAITRAQESVDVFCSFDPDYDLEVSSSKHRGPQLFKQYLRFVKYVSRGTQEKASSILENIGSNQQLSLEEVSYYDYDSPFEQEVAEALRERGYKVHTQVGSYGYRIDLGIVDPNNQSKYIIGIECDGASYHRSKSARERDIYRQRFLEEKGWQIERIWSRKWWSHPEEVLAELEEVIKEASTVEVKEIEKSSPALEEKNEVDYLMEDIEYDETFKELTRRILKLMIETKDKFSNRELQEKLNYKDTKGIRKALKPLRAQEIVEKEGQGRGTKYYINCRLSIFSAEKERQQVG